MKESELRKLAVCRQCGKKIGMSDLPFFYKVKVSRYGIDAKAFKRQAVGPYSCGWFNTN